MKIVTVNVPKSYIDAINKLIGENGLYPSRSELIRNAVREFLLKELHLAKQICKEKKYIPIKRKLEIESILENKELVNIPEIKINENGEKEKTFKTFKIIRKLDSPE